MKEVFVINFEKSGVAQARLIKATCEEEARAYFEAKEPTATIYGVSLDNVGYASRGMPCDVVPDGWAAPVEEEAPETADTFPFPISTNEIEAKCRELRQLQNLIAEAEQEAEAIKDAIKAHMGDSEELRAGEYMVTWKPVKSSRLDTTALRKALPDVAERFTKTTTCRRFCVA